MATRKEAPGSTAPFSAVNGSSYGSFYTRRQNGKIVICGWPRKRPSWSNATNLDQREGMKLLNTYMRDQYYLESVAARLMARGSAYAYRDVLARAMMGRFIDIDLRQFMNAQELLDEITTTPGSMLVRTDVQWVGLDPPATDKILGFTAGAFSPDWQDAVSGGGGLWSGFVPSSPVTQASSGLATSFNLGSGSVSDTAAGLLVSLASDAGAAHIRGIVGAVPTPPYELHALIAMQLVGNPATSLAIGWYDGSAKLQLLELNQASGAPVGVNVQNWNSTTSYSGAAASPGQMTTAALNWIKLKDDGTNITFGLGQDGENFIDIYSHAKSTAFLGASGYSNFILGGQPQNGAMLVTALAWDH